MLRISRARVGQDLTLEIMNRVTSLSLMQSQITFFGVSIIIYSS